MNDKELKQLKEEIPQWDGESEIQYFKRVIFLQDCNLKALKNYLARLKNEP